VISPKSRAVFNPAENGVKFKVFWRVNISIQPPTNELLTFRLRGKKGGSAWKS
jgi:hypothetical protein